MATHGQRFPIIPELGAHHPDSSLAFAEQLSPGHVYANLGLDTGDPQVNAYNDAFCFVEYALSTPEQAGDSDYFTYAERKIDEVLSWPGADLTNHTVLKARLLALSLPAFRARASHFRCGPDGLPVDEPPVESPVPQIIDNMYVGVNQVLEEFLRTPAVSRNGYVGSISEIITMSLLLLGRRLPYVGSPREEENVFIPDNQDMYVIDRHGKLPISVKHRGGDHESPFVLTLRIAELVANSPLNLNHTAWALVKNARRARLSDVEVSTLTSLLGQVDAAIQDFRAQGLPDMAVDLSQVPGQRRTSN